MPEFFNTPLIFSSFIKRFAIRGREYLRTLGKYYIIDIGLRNFLLSFRNRDRGHAIENVVCFELLRRSYDVASERSCYPWSRGWTLPMMASSP